MKKITDIILIEDDFPGCTMGTIALPYGTIQIDAPPSPEDVRVYRASMMGMKTGAERILINLDSHLDRSLGAKLMECPIVMHEKTADLIKSRPSNVKLQNEDTGSDWESVNGIGNVRWAPPEITFTTDLALHWSGVPVNITHNPGCNPGASWVDIPSENIIFIGDLVVKNQPAFYGQADLPTWIASIQQLVLTHKDRIIISGRGGELKFSDLEKQIETLTNANKILESVAGSNLSTEKMEKIADKIFALEDYPQKHHNKYQQRVRYGIKQFLLSAS